MDSLAYPIFTLVSMSVRSQFNNIMDDAYTRFVDSVMIMAVGIETIYLIRYGFLIAFDKAMPDVIEPKITGVIEHALFMIMMLGLLQSGLALDTFIALRQMLVEGFTGSTRPAGQQIALSLELMDLAFSATNVVNSVSVMNADTGVKATSVMLSLMADGSPQITAGIMLILNECLFRVGMALLPLMVYCACYKQSRPLFEVWFQYSFSLVIQAATLAVVVKAAAAVVGMFVGFITATVLVSRYAATPALGLYMVSELQQSMIQFGLGMSISTLTIWFPSNVASYGGRALYSATTRVLVGGAVTNRQGGGAGKNLG